jgi:DNA-binding CsgD family transcriptional regulator
MVHPAGLAVAAGLALPVAPGGSRVPLAASREGAHAPCRVVPSAGSAIDGSRSGWCSCVVGAAVGLAGRVGELREVSALLSGQSDSAAMLVVGEAGVGKSRLVAAAADAVARAGNVVLSGWCLPLAGGLPFLPVLDVVRAVGQVDEGRLLKDALTDCPPFVVGEIHRFAPELCSAQEPSVYDEADGGWRKQREFDALARLLDAAAALRPVAMLIEDVHWADATTLEFLEYVLSPGHAIAVPVVLTCRSDEDAGPTLAAWLERLQRNRRVARLDLAPLSEAETSEQIALLLGRPPTESLTREIFPRSEGNAFFTEQLVAAGVEGGAGLPPGLTSLLLSRVDQVRGVPRQVLGTLAVATRPLDERALAKLCEQPVEVVQDALRDLLAARLLRRPDTAGRYQLRHALLAETVGTELLAGVRADLHARVADLLAATDDPAVSAEVAEHFAAAGRSVDELRWRVIAARHADSVFAAAEAAAHWQRVIALSADAPVGAAIEGMSLAQVYGATEDALTLAGDDEAAGRLAEEALRRLADADPASQADVLRRAGNARGIAAPEHGLELLYQALAIYEQLPPSAGRVKTMKEIAGILHNHGRPAEGREFIDRGAEVAEQAGLAYPLFEFRCIQAMYLAQTDPDEALRRIEALRDQLSERDGPGPYIWVAIFHSNILDSLCRLSDIEAALSPALRMASAYGMDQSFKVALVRGNLVCALLDLGATDAAARWIEPVTQDSAGLSTWFDYANLADIEMLRGNLDESLRRWDEIEQVPASTLAFQASGAWARAELDLWRDEAATAFERIELMLSRLAAAGESDFDAPLLVFGLRACADLAEQARSRRDAARVQAAMSSADRLSQLRTLFARDPLAPNPSRLTADAEKASWDAEHRRLTGESHPELWDRAATAWAGVSRCRHSAYARWRQAEALLAEPGGRAATTPVLRMAGEEARQHVPLSTAISDLARRARIELTEPPPAVATQPTKSSGVRGVTDRELAVLRLLAEGKTNSEIGAALFISRKTVSVHVTNILRKLNVTTRVQAAAVAERAGILQRG